MKTQSVDPQIHVLVKELENSRSRLEKYSSDLEVLQEEASAVFPKKMDARTAYHLDDKLKVISSFYQTILTVRQEINKLIIHEIDIRRKISKDEVNKDNEVDIRKLVEELDDKGYKVQELKEESKELGLDVPDESESEELEISD